MIIKIIENKTSWSGKNNRTLAAIDYNAKKGELIDLQNTYALDVDSFKGHIQYIEAQNDRVEEHRKALHVIFSLAYNELCDDETIKDLVGDYMTQMGYGDQPYSIHKHTDREHIHFHIVSTRIDKNTGKKINDSNEQRRSNRLREELSLKYRLAEYKDIELTERGLVFDLNSAIKEILKKKPQNLRAFNKYAEDYGVRVEKRGQGYIVFSKDSEKGLKSSLLPIFKERALAKVLSTNNYYRTKSKKEIIKVLERFIENGERLYIADFVRELNRQKIRVKFARNSGGIYGVSFYHNFIEFKGSELGEKFSWNNLTRLIEVKAKSKRKIVSTINAKSRSTQMSSILNEVKKLSRVGQGIRGKSTDDLSADKPPIDDDDDDDVRVTDKKRMT